MEGEILKIKYDADVDALYIALAEGEVADSEQVHAGVVIHYDQADNLIGVEVLHVQKRDLPINLEQIHVDVA